MKTKKKPKIYDVEVRRTGWGWNTIRVTAKNEKDAKDVALYMAGNFDYSEKSSEYVVTGVTKIKIIK